VPYDIKRRGSKWCVVGGSTGSRTFGCHDTREKAVKQQRALYRNAPESAASIQMSDDGASLPPMSTHGERELERRFARSKGEEKTKLLNLRLAPEMKNLWSEAAEREGLSLSEYVRELVTEHALTDPESEAEMSATETETETVEGEEGETETLAVAEAVAEPEVELKREPWEGVLGTIGSPTSDGRYLRPDEIENRELPVPFSVQPALAEGHNGAIVAGRIEDLDYIPFAQFEHKNDFYAEDLIASMPDQAVVIFGKGTVDDSPAGQEAKRLIENGADVSIDGLRFDGSVIDAETFAEVDVADLEMDEVFSGIMDGSYLQGLSGKIAGVTVVSEGAFEEARVIITASASLRIVPTEDSAAERFAVLIAAAGPVKPPREWFENPGLRELTPLKISKEGRVSGHLADWNGCHTGFMGVCVPPFHSASEFAYFNVGEIETAEGDLVPCGKLMFSMSGKGHASTDPRLSYQDIQRYYDDATKVGAFVRAGSDRFGIWLAGALRPGLSEIEVQHLRTHPPSGDWRPIRGGDSDLIAAFSVPIGGFPIPRGEALVASAGGEISAIITAPLNVVAMTEHNTRLRRRQARLERAMGTGEKTRAEMRREAMERLDNSGDD
jgi:hypothetical protein